ncbi:MAG TPA: M36 family metallopeptidase [Kofleriaceae bacterium]
MRSSLLQLSLFGFATASLLASCTADVSILTEETSAPNGAKIIRGDQPLTAPTNAPRDRVIRDYLKTRGAGAAVDQLQVTRVTSPYAGITHVTMEQTVDGLRVYGAYAKAAINSQGQLIQIIDNVVRPQLTTHRPGLSAADALAVAYDQLGFTMTSEELGVSGVKTFFEPGTDFLREPSVELVAYVDGRGVLRQGYLVETWYRADNQLEETLIGYDGTVESSITRTAGDSYNVFTEDPLKGGQTTVSGPAPVSPAGTTPSPAGWLGSGSQSTQNILGNNAHSYLDTDANNSPDNLAGNTAVADGNFLTAVDLSQTPSTSSNRNVAVQNLFYFNNVVHDALYRMGFDEAAGNFQIDNFGRGGAGNDPVNAEAQDGSGTDNANFSTPNDGSSPRMQMYLWTPGGGDEVLTATAAYAAVHAGFGPATTNAGVTGGLALASVADGCTAFTGVSGKIAIIDRGSCDFTVKVFNAQAAGATAAIVVNLASDSIFAMGGTNRRIKIPSVMVGKTDGAALKTQAGASATVHKDPTPPPQLDGDVDADIVFHEYGHGLTWRMIGSMSGVFSGAIGEGASDTNAFFLNGDDLIGEYSFSDTVNGIRRAPYGSYPYTYKDYCNQGCEVHADGEIYAAATWKFRQLALNAGLTNDQAYEWWVQAMNYTPAGPSFENMRDGMVQAASVLGHDPCLVWTAFASRGIGVGSSATSIKGGRAVNVVESYAVPAGCPAP